MRILNLVIAALVAVAAPAASAADYYLVSANHNQIALIDRDAITVDSNGERVAPMVAIRRNARTLDLGFAYAVVGTRFDCANRRVQAISLVVFDINGQPSPQQPADSPPVWTAVQPSSQADNALQFVCAKRGDPKAPGFRMQGLTLAQIVARALDGTWPYDRVHPDRPEAP